MLVGVLVFSVKMGEKIGKRRRRWRRLGEGVDDNDEMNAKYTRE